MNSNRATRNEIEAIAQQASKTKKADKYPATVRMASDYFGGQIQLNDSKLTVISTPAEFSWFESADPKGKVTAFELFFVGECLPGRYPLAPNDAPVWMSLALLDNFNEVETGFVQGGEVILEVFDRENKHIQGTLENVIVEIKMGPTITISSGFFSSPPNKR